MTTPERPIEGDQKEDGQSEATILSEGNRLPEDRIVVIDHPTPPSQDNQISRRQALALMGLTFVGGAATTALIYENQQNSQSNSPIISPDSSGINPSQPTKEQISTVEPALTPEPSIERIPGFLYPGDAIYKIENPERRVAITIDDCNSDEVIQEYLDLADEFEAQGYPVSFTFFPTGMSAISFPGTLNKIIEKGHELGTHTLDHPFLTQLDGKSSDPDKRARQRSRLIREEIEKGLEAIQSSLNIDYRVRFFRAPFGDGAAAGTPLDPDIEKACKELGLVIAGWDKDSLDTSTGTYDARNENKAAQRMINNIGRIKQGNIILFHSNWPNSVDGVRKLLQNLMAEGKLKADRTLSEMVKFGDSIPSSGVIYQNTTL